MSKYIDFKDAIDYNKLKDVTTMIKHEGIIVFPTETVYGIGVNGLDEKSIKKLYEVKKRPLNNPINLLVSNIDMINQVASDITELEYALINKFFPGPLTIILKKKDIVPNILTANGDTVGIRMAENKIALELINSAGVPIATSSANISGDSNKVNIDTTINDFEDKVDYYIDGGKSKIGLASTIVQVIDNVPHILRQGPITEEQIKKVCDNIKQ